MHQDRKITFTTSPGVYLDTPLDQKLLDPPRAEGREQGLSCPKVEAGLEIFLAFVPLRRQLRPQSPLVFLAFLCLCGSRNFSFLRSSLQFYSRLHPLLLHPTAATAPSPECTGQGCNPSSMFTDRNVVLLLMTPYRSVKFFRENERLFIQVYLPL